ncbi:MAG: HAMP domain-containing histidine kinase [bacterium]|nr:HAMP domain-containing histidine kinase [bacterium]
MFNTFLTAFKNGLRRIREQPQLIYTLVVAIVIVVAFVFVVQRFSTLAIDANKRIISIRIGSVLDTFVKFANDATLDHAFLSEKIRDLRTTNTTFIDFYIVEATTEGFLVIASDDPEDIGRIDSDHRFLYSLALSDGSRAFTQEFPGEAARFQTARAIFNDEQGVVRIVFVSQQLSEADKVIQTHIRNSIIVFVIIMVILMLLFLRHARIIDYGALYRKLKGVDKMKDDFISMASHELRAPLTVIKGYMEYIGDIQHLNDTERKYVTRVKESSDRLDLLIEDLLDVSRLNQGRMKFTFETFDPAAIIKETADTFTHLAQLKGLALAIDVTQSAHIMADKNRLKQVVVNLLSNAVKYTQQGSITVILSGDTKYLSISVKDTGIGISETEQKNLFTKFYRVQSDEVNMQSGTGLGLWITQQIVQKMGGYITINSVKGKGSDFTIKFPNV